MDYEKTMRTNPTPSIVRIPCLPHQQKRTFFHFYEFFNPTFSEIFSLNLSLLIICEKHTTKSESSLLSLFLIGKLLPKLKSLKLKDKNVALPKTRRLDDDSLHPTDSAHPTETSHPTHIIPSIAAIVPDEVPSFKKTVLGLRHRLTDRIHEIERPTKSTIQRHYKIHPTKHHIASRTEHEYNMGDDDEDSFKNNENYKKDFSKHSKAIDVINERGKAENSDKRYLLQITHDSASIVPRSRHGHVHPNHVTGESRRKIHKHKNKHKETMDITGILKGSVFSGGALNTNNRIAPSTLLPSGSTAGLGHIDLASLPIINNNARAMYFQRLQSNMKPTLDFTTQNSAFLHNLPASPNKLTPNSEELLGLGAKRWERNRFNRKKERHQHNETEMHRHEYGKIN